jgi:hypothetical protein
MGSIIAYGATGIFPSIHTMALGLLALELKFLKII